MPYVKLEFDKDEYEKIEALKREYGLKQTTELIRFLITSHYKMIKRQNEGGRQPSL